MFDSFRKHWKAYLAWFAALSAVIIVGTHYLVAHSDAFDTASSFVKANPEVIQTAGTVQDVTLSWDGVSIEVSGGSGSAQFTLNISGSKSSPQAYVELRKRGIWEVQFARLLPVDGKTVILKEVAL